MDVEIRKCQNCSNEFRIELEDFEFYEKIKVPAPTFCPECRAIRRLLFRGERVFYKRKCDLCEKSIVSMYSQDNLFKIYCPTCWYSDNWDSLNYAMEYNFSQSFFEQFKKLQLVVPKIALYQAKNINSPWVNRENSSKNCYLNVGGIGNEDSAYNTYAIQCKDILDNLLILKSELSFGNIFIKNCYKVFFSQFCFDCQDVYFSFNCRGCHDVIGCTNLRNKSFWIFNKPVTEKEYGEFLNTHISGGYLKLKELRQKFEENRVLFPYSESLSIMAVNSVGDFIENCKNCKICFNITESENMKYVFTAGWAHDCYDVISAGPNTQLAYECISGLQDCSKIMFLETSKNSQDSLYSQHIENCSNCFGCIGLRNKQYCILNKQYTKEEYMDLIPRIIEHMNEMPYISQIANSQGQIVKEIIYKYGEFFPSELSPFSYNETIAQEYFPLTKEQAIEQGYTWKDAETRNIQPTITSEQLPDHIKDVDDTILKQVIECQHNGTCNEQCTTAFKIIPQELEFYRKMNLPLPRLCPNCRHYQRIKQRNPLKLWKRKCQCNGIKSEHGIYQNTITHTHGTEPCTNEFQTTYAPERPEIVYCEVCYQQEVV